MKFEKGHQSNGGRPKGSQNKSKLINKNLDRALALCQEQFEKDIMALSPKERIQLWEKLHEYRMPKLTRERKDYGPCPECPEPIMICKEVVHRGMRPDEGYITIEE